jgi:hypothetical protein
MVNGLGYRRGPRPRVFGDIRARHVDFRPRLGFRCTCGACFHRPPCPWKHTCIKYDLGRYEPGPLACEWRAGHGQWDAERRGERIAFRTFKPLGKPSSPLPWGHAQVAGPPG